MKAQGEIEREARRVLRKLAAPGAHLRPDGAVYRIASREAAEARGAPVAADIVAAFAGHGWIRRAGAPGCFVVSDVGKGWFDRATAACDPFAAQHRMPRRALVKDDAGIAQPVTIDDAESPLTRLKQRGLLQGAQFEAGEKLRRDFTLARMMPRLGVDYAAPQVRGQVPDANFSDIVLAAKQRFAKAMTAVGPGLSDLLFDVCCHLRGLEDAERAHGWPSRAARVVLGIALDRLAEHYGLHQRGRARLRAWSMEE